MQLIRFSHLTKTQNERLMRLLTYNVDFNKLWGTETGRSITGEFSGTLTGIFPKLKIQIKADNKTDRALVLETFNQDYDTVTYYDPEYKSYVAKTFYFGDVSTAVKRASGDDDSTIKYEKIEVEIVTVSKRTASDKKTNIWWT